MGRRWLGDEDCCENQIYKNPFMMRNLFTDSDALLFGCLVCVCVRVRR